MPAPLQRRDWYPWIAAGAYLALAGVYLLYWNYVDYFIDDWFLSRHFRQAAAKGLPGVLEFAVQAARNKIYGVFRMQWLGILYGFLVTVVGGYSARFNFALLLALHAACCWLLCQALWRLGVDRRLSFLAGALHLLAPTAHFALFTYLTNPFFVFSSFWVLLLLWWFARQEPEARRGPGFVLPAAAFAVAGLFSGEQTFLLLWLIVPLALLCFAPDRPAVRVIPPIWVVIILAGGSYLLWVNQAPLRQTGFDRRYEWAWGQISKSASLLYDEIRRITGLPSDAPFQISPTTLDLVLALGAATLVAALLWIWGDSLGRGPGWWRAWLFAVAGVLLAYAPVLLIGGGYSRFRYHYVPSPYFGLAGAAACWLGTKGPWPRVTPAVLGGLLAGYCTLNAAADIRQCWIRQAIHHRALEAQLRGLKNVEPGDILIISGTSHEIGTAQHFTMHSSVSANPFAEWATGVAPLEVGLEIIDVHGRLVLVQQDYYRPLSAGDMKRIHVLLSSHQATFSGREWLAQEVTSQRFQLLALKGGSLPAGGGKATFSREQLALLQERIYFAKISSPQRPVFIQP